MSAPGVLTWLQPATGLLRLGVMVNGYNALVEECDVDAPQEIKPVFLLQGGPWASVVDVGERHITCTLKMPIRLQRDGTIEPAAWEILNAAQNGTALRIDTNHVVSHSYLTAENNASDKNELLGLDSLLIKTLRLSADEAKGVNLEVTLEGIINARSASAYAIPDDSYMRGGRVVSFNECSCSRFYSSLRSCMMLDISIENKIELEAFIPPITANNRDPNQAQGGSFAGEPNYAFMPDQVGVAGVSTSLLRGTYEEMVRLGGDKESFIHGGFNWQSNGSVRDNVVYKFGPVNVTLKTPIYSPSQQKLTAILLKRTVKFLATSSPINPNFFTLD